MDQARPFILASKDLCYEANPVLWNVFCALTGRNIGQPNYVWTEQDVVVFMLALRPADARKSSAAFERVQQ